MKPDEVKAAREAFERMVDRFDRLTSAWAHLRMDTPEDQDVHDRLVRASRESIEAARRALDGPR